MHDDNGNSGDDENTYGIGLHIGGASPRKVVVENTIVERSARSGIVVEQSCATTGVRSTLTMAARGVRNNLLRGMGSLFSAVCSEAKLSHCLTTAQ